MTLSARGALGAVVLVPALVVLTACGGSTSTTAPATPASNASTPATTSAAAPTSMSTPAPPKHRQLTSNELVKTLLGLDDMPAGFTADKPDLKDQNVTFCHYKQPNRENGYAMITFEQGSTSAIGNTLRQYDSAADASAQQDALAKAVRAGCTMTYEGTKLTISQMSAPKLGDRTVGVSMKGAGATYAEVFVQVGPVVLVVGEASVGSPDVARVTALAKKSILKYTRAATRR